MNGLDVSYQQEFLQITRELAWKDTVVVAVMHDINLSIQFADELFFFKEGLLAAHGEPEMIIDENLLEFVFQVKTSIIKNPLNGQPLVIFK